MDKAERWSHILRTPLTSVRLVVDLCLRKGDELPRATVAAYLEIAMEQIKKLELAIVEVERDTVREAADEEYDVIVLHEEVAMPIVIRSPRRRSFSANL